MFWHVAPECLHLDSTQLRTHAKLKICSSFPNTALWVAAWCLASKGFSGNPLPANIDCNFRTGPSSSAVCCLQYWCSPVGERERESERCGKRKWGSDWAITPSLHLLAGAKVSPRGTIRKLNYFPHSSSAAATSASGLLLFFLLLECFIHLRLTPPTQPWTPVEQ